MNDLVISLEITALGMGLVFAAIILLWWMMALLTGILAEKESESDEAESFALTPNPSPVERRDQRAQAAAIAVSTALAEQTCHAPALHTPPTAIVSAWQLGMRTRQLSEKGLPVVRKPRKVG